MGLSGRLSTGECSRSATPALPSKRERFVSEMESSLDQCLIGIDNKVIESKHTSVVSNSSAAAPLVRFKNGPSVIG